MQTSAAVEDWLRVHRQLLAMENAFTDLALRAAVGEVPPEQLDEERQRLMHMRVLCTAVYEKAFPKPAGARSGNGASSVVPYMNQGQSASGTAAPNETDNAGGDGSSDDEARPGRKPTK